MKNRTRLWLEILLIVALIGLLALAAALFLFDWRLDRSTSAIKAEDGLRKIELATRPPLSEDS